MIHFNFFHNRYGSWHFYLGFKEMLSNLSYQGYANSKQAAGTHEPILLAKCCFVLPIPVLRNYPIVGDINKDFKLYK